MTQARSPATLLDRRQLPWRRARVRRWSRPDDLAGMATMFAAIPSLPHVELAHLTERMIDRMNKIDGDPDLEDLREDDEDPHDCEKEDAL